MLDQTFSARTLHRLCSVSEVIEFGLGGKTDEQICFFEEIASKINHDNFELSEFKCFKRNGKPVYKAKNKYDHFAIKKANENIKRIFGVSSSDRRLLVNQIKVLLEENSPFHIVKVDISSFFESVDKKELLDKCWDNPILSHLTKKIITNLLDDGQFKNKSGLPRGLSVSATLSELYLEDLDKHIREMEGIYYSARYVDDIVIFCIPTATETQEKVEEYITKMGLSINRGKTETKRNKTDKYPIIIDYLGYQFCKSENGVSVDIAPNKVKKIKTRIIKSFLSYLKDGSFYLLEKRLQFLTGNFSLDSKSKVEGEPLKTGIYYNYSEISPDASSLDQLDSFLIKLIYSKHNSLGKKIRSRLTPRQRRALRKYSFKTGFHKKITHKFSYLDVVLIRRCWTNE